MPSVEIWFLVAGLGIFLLGINQMEFGLKNLAGKSFRVFLKKHTSNPFKGILVGLFITALLQSSSVVSLMVLAFVGSGIIPLRNAIAIIFGTNLGTTVTGWIVALLGFKFPIDAFALPFLGLGGILITFFGRRIFFVELGRFMVGFGALFMGLDYMKNAILIDAESFSFFEDLQLLPQFFFPIGLLLTSIIQSSSATMAITLSALYTGVIPLEVAAAIVIGSDLGTTTTVMLGAAKGNYVKKQVAVSHVGFNFVSAIIALIILQPLLYLVTSVLEIEDSLFQLVAFHSFFNLIGILCMFPFLNKFSSLVQKIVKPKSISLSPLLESVPHEVIDGAFEAIKKEGQDLLERIKKYRKACFVLEEGGFKAAFGPKKMSNLEMYKEIQQKEGEIIAYYLKVNREKMTEEESRMLQNLIHGVKRMTLAAKNIKNVNHTINDLRERDEPVFNELKSAIQKQYTSFYEFIKVHTDEVLITNEINAAYRSNVNSIYNLIDEKHLNKNELTSYLHLNSELRQFKINFSEAYNSFIR